MSNLKFKILVVDDDAELRSLVAESLEFEGYQTLQAESAVKALEICQNENIDIIITDVRMPQITGVQFFDLVKNKNIPFIVMTGDPASEIDMQKARQKGIRAYFEKPFDEQQMMATIALVLYEKLETQNKEKLSLESEYFKIPIQNLSDYSNVNDGVYLKVSPEQYVKIASHPSKVASDKISILKSKNIDCLYISKKDYAQSVSWGEKDSNVYAPDVKLSLEQKMALFGHISEHFLDPLHFEGVDEDNLNSAKIAVESSLRFLTQTNDFYHLISLLYNSAPDILGHSVSTAVVSVLMMKKIGWNKPSVLFKIAMSGMLHDIGCIEDKKLRSELNNIIPFNTVMNIAHSQAGCNFLSKFSFVPEEVIQAVMYHHENLLGTGPFKLVGVKLQPLMRLITTANAFCYMHTQKPWGSGMTIQQTFHGLTVDKKGEFDPVMIKALMELFSYQVPSEFEKVKVAKYAS